MVSLLDRFVNRVDFDSYEDFKENFEIEVPENFNFGYDVVDKYAEENPEKLALVWCNDYNEKHNFTFEDIKKNSNKVANFLLDAGIKKGDAVLLTLKSRFEFWFILIALHKIGAVAIPATHMLKVKDITYRVKSGNIKGIISVNENGLPDLFDKSEEAMLKSSDLNEPLKKFLVNSEKREKWYSFQEEFEKASDEFNRNEKVDLNHEEDPMLVYFSSGTTGMPKMIQHCFSYPLGHIITAKYWQNVVEDGLHYTVADTGWAKSSWGQIYGQWIAGSAIFVYDYDKFDALKVIEKAIEHEITTFCAPPTIYRFLIKEDLSKYDFSGLQYAVTAGEPLNPEVFIRFKEFTGLEIREGFGQSETVVCIANFPWIEPNPGSLGKPSPGFDIELRDSEDIRVESGVEGEIVIKTNDKIPVGLFRGYYLNKDKTKEVWYDGGYHMGDVAWMDADDYIWFVGRTDDVIKSSGYRIGPFEVESAVITHPSVLECAITAYPDKIRGQVVKATVVLTKGYEPSEELKLEIQNHVKEITAPYKYPRIVEFREELPKTLSGKIKRGEIHHNDKKSYYKI